MQQYNKTVKIYAMCDIRKLATPTVLCDFRYFHIVLVAQISFSDSDCQQIAHNGVDTSPEKSADTGDLESKCCKSCI